MTSQEFIAKWCNRSGVPGPAYGLNEEQGAQSHFLDLCDLLGVPKPGSVAGYRFEEKGAIIGGRAGYCDVFMRGVFAWENKAPGKNLDAALKQLLTYSLALSSPPILVVSDRLTIRIHTQFTGHPSQTHEVRLEEMDQPDKLTLLRRVWTAPDSFKPRETNRDITEAAARSFANLADGLRRRGAAAGEAPEAAQQRANQVAHFLTQCLFCFFAEDVGLLPGRMFERLVNNRHITSDKLTQGLSDLFKAMQNGGMFGADDIPWFNGGLFRTIAVPRLQIVDVTELRNAAALNWSAIDVSIFGTLFERGLDPAKRSQLGAHYTDPATILRIVEPVVQRPLLQLWEQTSQGMKAQLAQSKRKGDSNYRAAQARFIEWLDRLRDYRVLDPACGSGNFLFLGLKALKDIEHKSHLDAAALGLDREADLVTGPHNMLGIELNEYAAELARVTVWIGELQWRLAHGYEFKTNPVLEPLDHIECRDALLTWVPMADDSPGKSSGRAEGHSIVRAEPVEALWPKASVVIGNPPFLGDKKMRAELGGTYTETLRETYKGRVPGGADLVCYWFEKARQAIQSNGLGAAGLVATQAIRAGSNRFVMAAICASTKIYEAWSDETWVNDGAAVRVSLVCFGHADQQPLLDGIAVPRIPADLSSSPDGLDITTAKLLPSNSGAAFQGPVKVGAFDIPGSIARDWLQQPNVNGKSNALSVRPWANGQDLAKRSSDTWIIDFGASMSEAEAALFECPYAHARLHIKPQREAQNDQGRRRYWWIHGRAGDEYRRACDSISRYIATPRVAKHRFFVWLPSKVWPDSRLYAVTRADDTTYGVLSSRIHEVWSLANASMHGVGNDPTYNAKSCFETFPFPPGLTPFDTAHQRTEPIEGGALVPAGLPSTLNEARMERMSGAPSKTPKDAERPASAPSSPAAHTQAKNASREIAENIARSAKRLNDLREAWLNPPEWTHRVPEVVPLGMATSPYPERIEPRPGLSEADLKALQKRTLTNLYNQRPAWLAMTHQQLDAAVAAAYGWADYTPAMRDEEILRRLLALNLERVGD